MVENYSVTQKESRIGKKRVYLLKIKRKVFRHVWFVRGMFLGLIILVVYLGLIRTSTVLERSKIRQNLFLVKLFLFPSEGIVKSQNGRTNILILGKGGGSHEAPDLTDTMMLVSLSGSDHDVVLISLPRDIWIKELRTKLNSVYYWGNKRQAGGGIALAKASVEEITGQQIHYAAVADFDSFINIVDLLGGVEVDVERSFTDEKYPIPGRENDMCSGDEQLRCRYETVSFNVGRQIMNGDQALKYARSRNAEGDEGTDFARAARAQKILRAIKDGVINARFLTSKGKIKEIINIINNNIETDIPKEHMAIIARFAFNARDNMTSYVLPEELLDNPPKLAKYDNLYVLIPKNDSWDEVKKWVEDVIQ